jgi:hypothetical protein
VDLPQAHGHARQPRHLFSRGKGLAQRCVRPPLLPTGWRRSPSSRVRVCRAQAAGEARELQHSLRSSKLTEALRGALAGSSDTAMLLALSPSSSHAAESERSLKFGLAAARVRTVGDAESSLGDG